MTDLTQDAKYLMNNEAFNKALDTVRQQALTAALACDVKDDLGRWRYLDSIRTVDKTRAHIAALAADPTTELVETDFYTEKSKSVFARITRR